MNILVIEDSAINQQAARQTLKDHNLTVVSSYDEAAKLLLRKRNYGKGWGLKPESEQPERFDAVLTDLMMDPSEVNLSPTGLASLTGQMPVGFPIVLIAALAGAKYIGCVTQTNHHNHPMSRVIDDLDGTGHNSYWHDDDRNGPRTTAPLRINGAIVGFFHNPVYHVQGFTCEACKGSKEIQGTCRTCSYNQLQGQPCNNCQDTQIASYPCHACKATGWKQGKDWGKVLGRLLEENDAKTAAA